MNQNLTDITIVQDKSGSMGSLREETIQGYDAFVQKQRSAPGQCKLSLMQFDTEFKNVYSGTDVKDVPPLTEYHPGGYTALLDAIGKTIVEVGSRLKGMPEPDRPSKVVIVITTDGLENSSREYTRDQVFAMIDHQSKVYKWEFLFLGANQDAILAGGNLGIKGANAMSSGKTGQAVGWGYQALGENMVKYRASNNADDLAWKKEQRDKQRKEGAVKDKLNQ